MSETHVRVSRVEGGQGAGSGEGQMVRNQSGSSIPTDWYQPLAQQPAELPET